MNVTIKIVDHKDQKYETVGNWGFTPEGDIWIEVSRLSDWRREMLIAVHELVEVLMCRQAGIGQQQVDNFDLSFEANHHPDNKGEPGDEPTAPYVRQHCIATGVERILAAELGVNWKEYEQELSNLPPVKTMNNQIDSNHEVPDDVKAMQEEYRKLNAELIGRPSPTIPISMDSAVEDQPDPQPPATCSKPADMLRSKVEDLPK